MAALDQVQDYISDTRTILLDTVAPYRYDDPSLLVAFNVTMLEAARLRGDLFSRANYANVPFFTAVDSTSVPMASQFRLALVFGIVGHALTRDQEDVQDARATTFMGLFYDILLGTRGAGIAAGRTSAPAASSSGAVPPNAMPAVPP
jgi:hypothetical protein